MFARWNRMAKQFSRIGKDITIAVKKGGSDPNANPALRRAIQNSRAVNMPKDKVDSAIKRASGRDAAGEPARPADGEAEADLGHRAPARPRGRERQARQGRGPQGRDPERRPRRLERPGARAMALEARDEERREGEDRIGGQRSQN